MSQKFWKPKFKTSGVVPRIFKEFTKKATTFAESLFENISRLAPLVFRVISQQKAFFLQKKYYETALRSVTSKQTP